MTTATPGCLREWWRNQVKRMRREDIYGSEEVGRPDVFLKREGYVSRARWTPWFAMSSFLYTLCGIYMIFTHEVLNRRYPVANGMLYWEGALLVLQGPISYWNDVHSFALDELASSVDKTTATCCFLVQIAKVFVLPYPENWIFSIALCAAGACFLWASTHLANLLSAAGEAELKSRAAATSEGDREGTGAEGAEAEQVDNLMTATAAGEVANREGPDDDASFVASIASSSRVERETPTISKRSREGISRAAPPRNGNSNKNNRSREGEEKERKQARAEVDTKFAAYLRWHTLWHVVLPVPAILGMACVRWAEGLPVLPGEVGELNLR